MTDRHVQEIRLDRVWRPELALNGRWEAARYWLHEGSPARDVHGTWAAGTLYPLYANSEADAQQLCDQLNASAAPLAGAADLTGIRDREAKHVARKPAP